MSNAMPKANISIPTKHSAMQITTATVAAFTRRWCVFAWGGCYSANRSKYSASDRQCRCHRSSHRSRQNLCNKATPQRMHATRHQRGAIQKTGETVAACSARTGVRWCVQFNACHYSVYADFNVASPTSRQAIQIHRRRASHSLRIGSLPFGLQSFS